MRTRDENKELTIREKAFEMIVKEGSDGLSMQKLAEAANVSPGTIYLYSKNCEDLLNQLYIGTGKLFGLRRRDVASMEKQVWILHELTLQFFLYVN